MRTSRLALAGMMGLLGASALADALKVEARTGGPSNKGLRANARYVHTNGTFNAGRNAEKTATGKGWFKGVTSESGGRYKARAGEVGHKYNTRDRVSLLADRRLRQRQRQA